MPTFSVIIASYNGAGTLPDVLAALAMAEGCGHDIEYLFVDNNSSDETSALFGRFIEARQGRVLTETRPGKSHALNCALAKARGDLIAFLDDDAIVSPKWFDAWAYACRRYRNAGVFVGAVGPLFLEPPPDWLVHLAKKGMSCASTPHDLREGPCSAQYTKGVNWAVRREAIGGALFNVEANNLIAGSKPVGGQDTEMARRIVAQGSDAVFVPQAFAQHIVRSHEMTLEALQERYQRIGRGVAAQRHKKRASALQLRVEIALLHTLRALLFSLGCKRIGAECLARGAMRSGRLEMIADS